jgi:hypothetical protein
MKVFICWSGERSKQLAETIHTWVRDVLQAVEPYLSSVDIDKGARWYSEIIDALEKSDIGLIILTQENLANQWIMFEAGAVARSVERGRACPILFDIKTADLKGPLSFFQTTEFTEDDFRSLVITINKGLERPLNDPALAKVFDKWWPDLESRVNAIMAATQSTEPEPHIRPPNELLEEGLLLMRRLDRQQQENDQMLRQLLSARSRPVQFFSGPSGPTGSIPVDPAGPSADTHFTSVVGGTGGVDASADLMRTPRMPPEGLTKRSDSERNE